MWHHWQTASGRPLQWQTHRSLPQCHCSTAVLHCHCSTVLHCHCSTAVAITGTDAVELAAVNVTACGSPRHPGVTAAPSESLPPASRQPPHRAIRRLAVAPDSPGVTGHGVPQCAWCTGAALPLTGPLSHCHSCQCHRLAGWPGRWPGDQVLPVLAGTGATGQAACGNAALRPALAARPTTGSSGSWPTRGAAAAHGRAVAVKNPRFCFCMPKIDINLWRV